MKILRHPASEIPSDEIEPLVAGSFFSSPGFLNLWQTLKGVPVWWVAREAGRITAVLPGVEFGKGVLKRFQSTPNGCYGRLSFDAGVDPGQRHEIARQVLRHVADAGYLRVYINDFYGSFEGAEGYRVQTAQTRIVEVSSNDFKPPSPKLRQNIERARRLGVTLTRFDRSRHFEQFQTLVKLSERRLGIKDRYPQEFYDRLARLSDEDERVQWLWCDHDGEPVTSLISVIEGDSLLHWQIHFDPSHAQLHATKLALTDSVRDLVDKGVRCINLGLTPEGATGVAEFKRRWGGEMRSYSILHGRSWLGRLI